MSARQIGDVVFDTMEARVPGLTPRVEVWEVLGLDGYGAQVSGLGNGQFQIVTKAFFTGAGDGNDADADSHLDACRDLVGTVVTVVNQFGRAYENILIVRRDDSSGENGKYACCMDGDARARRVQVMFDCVVTA